MQTNIISFWSYIPVSYEVILVEEKYGFFFFFKAIYSCLICPSRTLHGQYQTTRIPDVVLSKHVFYHSLGTENELEQTTAQLGVEFW